MKMRASWITSVAAGITFGIVAGFVIPRVDSFAYPVLVLTFLPLMLFGVVGYPQMMEMREEQKIRGGGFMRPLSEWGDLKRIYLPVWGRMLIWFFAVGVVAAITHLVVA